MPRFSILNRGFDRQQFGGQITDFAVNSHIVGTRMKPQKAPLTKVKFIEPMYARLVSELPEGKEWLYEVKFDGYRCLAGRDGKGVIPWSRRGNLFTTQFPQIARACVQLSPGTLVDGEIVAMDESGRVSFNLLHSYAAIRRRR
jgi:ATP-dependent DNA ligase